MNNIRVNGKILKRGTKIPAAIASLFVVASVALALPASGQQEPERPEGDRLSARAGDSAYEGASLGPGDAVRVTIHRQEDASGEFTVDELGYLVLPLVGNVNVLGKSVGELKVELTREYRRYFRDPSVRVTPLYRINVLGEVREPGLHAVDLTMTLPDVIALAGGLTPDGSLKKVDLLRSGREERWDLTDPEVRASGIGKLGLRSGDQILVREKGKGFWQVAPVVVSVVAAGATIVAVTSN